jgi:hypothetical protein
MPEALPERLTRFLSSSIRTATRLGVLLHLRAYRGRSVAARAVASTLGITGQQAEENLASLCGDGFLTVTIGGDLLYSYAPASDVIDHRLGEIDALWRRDRHAVLAAMPKVT